MSFYSQEFEFDAVSGVATCIPLPTHMRGALGRVYIKELGSTHNGWTANVYSRKGACVNAVDANVPGGAIATITDDGNGKCLFTVTAYDAMGLALGDTVYVKGSNRSGYNVRTHVVTAIGDPSDPQDFSESQTFTTDQNYSADGTGGWWQKKPFTPLLSDSAAYAVVPTAKLGVSAGQTEVEVLYDDHMYQNRDNQSETARRMTSSLYLEITPGGSGTKTYIISYTAQARHTIS